MSHHEAQAAAPLMLSVSGCRGIVGQSLTPEILCRYAGAIAAWVRDTSTTSTPRPRLVIACDGRKGGVTLKNCVAWAFASAGFAVSDIGVATTPTVGLMVQSLTADLGVTLTASHNPGQWNGLKVITRDGAAPDAAAADAIIDRFRKGVTAFTGPEAFGSVEHVKGAAETHVERAIEAIASVAPLDSIRARKFKVIVDSVNASGATAARLLLERLGCQLVHLNADSSGVFPHTPEPTAENLASICGEVPARKAALAFAQDPDADRLAIIDEQGRYIGEEYTLALATLSLLGAANAPKDKAELAANLSTSRMIDDVAARFGATVHRSAVGEANVVSAMRRAGAQIGGEGNGGVIWPQVTWIRDSIGAMGLVLALLARENRPLSQIVASIPSYAIEKRKAPVREGLAQRAVRAVEAAYKGRPGARVDTQDGVRADFPSSDGRGGAWVHVRASNTEPIVRFIAEAPTKQEASAILDEVDRIVAAS